MEHKPSVLNSRRFWIALTAQLCLLALGLIKGIDVSWPLASVAISVGSADAAEKLQFLRGAVNGKSKAK